MPFDFKNGLESLGKTYGPFTGWQWGTFGAVGWFVITFLRKKVAPTSNAATSPFAISNGQVLPSGSDPTGSMAIMGSLSDGLQQLQDSIGQLQTNIQPIGQNGAAVDLGMLELNLERAANLPRFASDQQTLLQWRDAVGTMIQSGQPNNAILTTIMNFFRSAGIPVDSLMPDSSGVTIGDNTATPPPPNPQPITSTRYLMPSYTPEQLNAFVTPGNVNPVPTSTAVDQEPQGMTLEQDLMWKLQHNLIHWAGVPGQSALVDGPAPTQQTTIATNQANYLLYTVKSGDSLWSISQNLLGDGSRWTQIYDLNQSLIGPNPNLIYPGQTYQIPAR